MDVGPCSNGKQRLLRAGVGIQSRIVGAVEPRSPRLNRLGLVGYVAKATPAFLTCEGLRLRITVHRCTVSDDFTSVTVADRRLFAGGIYNLNPHGVCDDGKSRSDPFGPLRKADRTPFDLINVAPRLGDDDLHYRQPQCAVGAGPNGDPLVGRTGRARVGGSDDDHPDALLACGRNEGPQVQVAGSVLLPQISPRADAQVSGTNAPLRCDPPRRRRQPAGVVGAFQITVDFAAPPSPVSSLHPLSCLCTVHKGNCTTFGVFVNSILLHFCLY